MYEVNFSINREYFPSKWKNRELYLPSRDMLSLTDQIAKLKIAENKQIK